MGTTNEDVRTAYEEGRIIKRRASDPAPATLEGGELWYRTDLDEYRGYEAGTGIVTIGTTAV
jgi:hypothetical protein